MSIMKNRKNRIIIIVVSVIAVLLGGFYIYTLDYYRADTAVLEAFSEDNNMIENQGNMTIFYPEKDMDKNIGLIFYPGGKVEAIAYAPILEKLTENGITCILLKMPFNLAVFNSKAADKVYDEFSAIDKWYLGGHSLGGAMASSYVEKNASKLDGLILMGAYPINDSDIPTLVIYGSEDLGLDVTKLEDAMNKFEIEGGNHAYFGDYGEQKGDGIASITREQQQNQAVELITDFLKID